MMNKIKNLSFIYCVTIFCLTMISCQQAESQSQNVKLTESFKDYWYEGNAELTRYNLEQARYGEIHHGEAVLVFVTEEFRSDKQVKYEGGSRDNVVPILKLNLTKKFNTGLYPYSTMSSIFTPVSRATILQSYYFYSGMVWSHFHPIQS